MSARLCWDFIQPQKFVGKLLGGSCCKEKLGLDICSAPNLKFWGWSLSGISGGLILVLGIGSVQPKLLMEFFEVCDEVSCACRCEVVLGVDSEVQMITLVGK